MRDLIAHHRIALDSNVLIYLIETQGQLADAAARVIDEIDGDASPAVMSVIGVIEVLVGPARVGDAAAFELIFEALGDLPIDVVGLDEPTAVDAAWIRGTLGIGLEDAIHLATARNAGATAFVTNDRRLRSIPRLDVVYLDDPVA